MIPVTPTAFSSNNRGFNNAQVGRFLSRFLVEFWKNQRTEKKNIE